MVKTQKTEEIERSGTSPEGILKSHEDPQKKQK